MTHYQVLQVSEHASVEIIRAARKALMRKYHPDNGTEPNPQMAVLVNLAYDTLTDPDKRKAYDAQISNPTIPFPQSTRRRSRAYPSPYEREEVPVVFNIEEILSQALSAATHATIQHVMDSNPALADVIRQVLDRRRAG